MHKIHYPPIVDILVSQTPPETMKLKNSQKGSRPEINVSDSRVFLSYSSRDIEEASKFKEMLMEVCPMLEIQEHPIVRTYEHNWKISCDNKIKKSTALICLVGRETHHSEAVSWEILRAHIYGIPTLAVYLEVHPPYPPLPKGLDSICTSKHEPISILKSMIQ